MLKCEYIACVNLHKLLKDRINGYLYLTIKNDSLIINIKGFRNIKFRYKIKDIHLEMNGKNLNYEKVVNIILNKYEEFIKSIFIKKGGH